MNLSDKTNDTGSFRRSKVSPKVSFTERRLSARDSHSKPKRKKTHVVYCLSLTKYKVIKKVCASFPGWVECDNEEDDWVRWLLNESSFFFLYGIKFLNI